MLLPIKFIAANIFVSGMIAGAVCGAVAVSTLSNPERLNRLKDYVKKSREGCKKQLGPRSNFGWKEKNLFGRDYVKKWEVSWLNL